MGKPTHVYLGIRQFIIGPTTYYFERVADGKMEAVGFQIKLEANRYAVEHNLLIMGDV